MRVCIYTLHILVTVFYLFFIHLFYLFVYLCIYLFIIFLVVVVVVVVGWGWWGGGGLGLVGGGWGGGGWGGWVRVGEVGGWGEGGAGMVSRKSSGTLSFYNAVRYKPTSTTWPRYFTNLCAIPNAQDTPYSTFDCEGLDKMSTIRILNNAWWPDS